ncbi:hypothetical protein O7632_31435 [Solwaraspora sp. WMMD406]|uniref:hypothetical protein n=1 Tax=Solwaraspora sp. WMMD406 TaxID=3016095 RepID=UPI0024166390|nr:hypothetical protein [Solwaraspora sp. WMMD406]MDG4768571.1 hypothetical protein [Solwaraspora sp. WMMD406]
MEQAAAARMRPAAIEGYRMAATIVILLVPYLVGQAAGFAMTARTFPPGLHLWLGYFAVGVFVTLFAAAVGWTMGKIFGAALAPLVAALSFLVLLGLLDRQGSAVVITGLPSMTVDPVILAVRFAAVTALLAALLWAPAGVRLRGRHLPIPVATAIVLIGVLLSTAIVVPREPAQDRATCIQGPTVLCVWPEHEKYLPRLEEMSGRIAALPDAFVLPPRMNEHGIDPGSQFGNRIDLRVGNSNAVPYFLIIEGSPWSYAGGIETAITSATFNFQGADDCAWPSVTEADMGRLEVFSAWLEAYLVGGAIPDYQTNAPAEMQQNWAEGRARLRDLSQEEQFQWAEGEVREIRGRYCASGE